MLGNDPKQWQTVQALSRSQKEKYPSNVKHGFIDLTSDSKGVTEQLKGVEAEYVFFVAYLQKDSDQENCDVNGVMLSNLLNALESIGSSKKIKRIILTTVAKRSGVHRGAQKNPMEETDPWVEVEGRPPNFYYIQERILVEKAKKQGREWVVTYLNTVIGIARGNFMNLATSLGLHCAISKELDSNLMFPGSEKFYICFESFTYSRLYAQFSLWAATEPKCANQAFNIVNGDNKSWQNMRLKQARCFHCHVPRNQFEVDWAKAPTQL